MQRELHGIWFWGGTFGLAFAVSLLGPALVNAQDTQAQAKDGVAAPTDTEIQEIPRADFAIEAGAVEERLQRIQSQIAVIDVVDTVKEELANILAECTALGKELSAARRHRALSGELNSLNFRLEALDDRCAKQISKLTGYGDDLEKLSAKNDQDIAVWTRTLQQAQRSSILKDAKDKTASILQGLHEGRSELQHRLSEVLGLQSQALDVRDRIRLTIQKVELAQRVQVQNVYERQYQPIWEPAAEADRGEEPTGYDVRFSWASTERYVSKSWALLVMQLLLAVAFGWLLSRMRALVAARIEKHKATGSIAWEDRAMESLRHPWAAALLVCLASIRFFEPEGGIEIAILVWSAALPLWFVILREMVPPQLHKALVWLGLLGALDIVGTLVSNHARAERILLLAELSLTFAGSILLVRLLRVAEVPKKVRDSVWFSVTALWARFAMVVSLLGVGATIWGYFYLGLEAAATAVMGTIAATAWMALARVIEAVVSVAVYEGRLDALRMIRTNRDVTTRMFRRVVRLGAVLLFIWSLANMTSAWRPVGQALSRALSADLGFGYTTLNLNVGDLLVFFVVLWLSWILARFLSFVLRDEILARLPMKEGVPYALTTFTRYTIIAIGFVAAVAVLGVPLDKIAIVLGALGVGIGFGLQKLVSNVVSGFILLTERPVRLRDKIQIDDLLGNVTHIGIRASSIRTFDGAEVIIPNDDLTSGRLVNWTLSDSQQRETITVGAAYGTDPNDVLRILRRLANEHEKVHKSPPPVAVFSGFGESSLDFELRVFMDSTDVFQVPSELKVAITEAFAKDGISIPFPQRDLHLRSVADAILPSKEASKPDDA